MSCKPLWFSARLSVSSMEFNAKAGVAESTTAVAAARDAACVWERNTNPSVCSLRRGDSSASVTSESHRRGARRAHPSHSRAFDCFYFFHSFTRTFHGADCVDAREIGLDHRSETDRERLALSRGAYR
jgi:hypothetical protein